MKKILFALAAICGLFVSANAQSVWKKGDQGVVVTADLLKYFETPTPVIAPVGATYEYCVLDNLIDKKGSVTVGATGNYSLYVLEGSSYSTLGLGARGAFHYALVPRVDLYAGLEIYKAFSSTSAGSGSTPLVPMFLLGGRYFFNDKLGISLEIGTANGHSAVDLGLAIRF